MKSITEPDIRLSFANCSKGEARRMNLPRDFAELPWDDLDFLGWRDPGAPQRAYLVVERDGGPFGVALRAAPNAARGFTSRSMCSLCMTPHSGAGVALMTARRTGEAGRRGASVGRYLCSDLSCSLYVRGVRRSVAGMEFEETLPLEDRIARTVANLHTFLDKVTG